MNIHNDNDESSEPLIEGSKLLSQWDSRAKEHSSPCSAVYLISLVLVATNIVTIVFGLAVYTRRSAPSCEVEATDTFFGKLPYKDVLWEIDERFVDTNPKVFYNETGADEYSAWSEIYPSGWVALTSQPGAELEGGASLAEWGSDKEQWRAGEQAWATTLMHQIHCLGTMKSTYAKLLEGGSMDKERMGHIPHCIEYFRQAFMCQADLTLEPPMQPVAWPIGTSGWGNIHRCRDWDAVLSALKQRSILREGGRWVRMMPEQKGYGS